MNVANIGSGHWRVLLMLSCPTALNTMLELSYAIRNPGECRAVAADFLSRPLLLEDLTLTLSSPLPPCSGSSETRAELRGSGEGTRPVLAAGRQTVPLGVLQVHR